MRFFKGKAEKELDGIILRLEMNMSNNYKDAADPIRFIHDRMPLIMSEELIGSWIKPDSDPDMIVQQALTQMVAEKA